MAERQPAVIDQNKKHFPTGDGEDGCTLVEWEPDYKRFDSPLESMKTCWRSWKRLSMITR